MGGSDNGVQLPLYAIWVMGAVMMNLPQGVSMHSHSMQVSEISIVQLQADDLRHVFQEHLLKKQAWLVATEQNQHFVHQHRRLAVTKAIQVEELGSPVAAAEAKLVQQAGLDATVWAHSGWQFQEVNQLAGSLLIKGANNVIKYILLAQDTPDLKLCFCLLEPDTWLSRQKQWQFQADGIAFHDKVTVVFRWQSKQSSGSPM